MSRQLIRQYFTNHLYALDRWLNVLFGGSSKEFISTRIYNRRFSNIIALWLYIILNRIDKNHCEKAARKDYDPDHSSEAVLY